MVKVPYKPAIAVTEKDRQVSFKEEFKGEVFDVPVKFPKGLGAEHPFEFSDFEKIYKKVGLVSGGVNKIVDEIVGDFNVEADNVKAQTILESFINDSDFKISLKPWIREAVLKGNGFMEIDAKESQVRVMNANSMYVRRNKKGKVLGFNQFKGGMAHFSRDKDKVVPFTTKEMVHLKINKIPNDPYGIGIVYANERVIENIILNEQDNQKLISRKAGAPIHVRLGVGQGAVQQEDIDTFKGNLQYMQNSTEWVTDGSTEISTIDFSGIGDNIIKNLDHNIEMLAAGMEIPLVLFGKANVPEGLAKAQKEIFNRKIQSIREEIESIIEMIFKQILLKNNLDAKIDFTWELPTNEEKNLRLSEIEKALKNTFLSEPLKAALEIEYATVLGLDDLVNILTKPKDAEQVADDKRKKEEAELRQPEVPGEKPTAKTQKAEIKVKEKIEVKEKEKVIITEAEMQEMTIREFANITELPGFNYSDYLISILKRLKVEKFSDLRALTEADVAEGLLTANQVNRLGLILKDGFRRNKTMKKITADIKAGIDLKDRKIGERITLSAGSRPSVIARTEVVRLSNLGLKDMYKENGIERYRYLAANDNRTSEICLSLDGSVFPLSEGAPGINMPPMHPNCRSTIVGVVE